VDQFTIFEYIGVNLKILQKTENQLAKFENESRRNFLSFTLYRIREKNL